MSPDPNLALIVAVFLLAGFVKGVIGLGLPTVAIGLLATRMAPPQALAIVIVPAILTNIWQTFAGPYLTDILRRLWPMLVGLLVGIWASSGLMTGPYARYGTRVAGPQVGAIAVMSRKGGGHVGVVSGVDANGNPIIISGNHNRTVAETVYPRSRVTAYVVPN